MNWSANLSTMSPNTAKGRNQLERTIDLPESERHSLLSSKRRRTVIDILEEQTAELHLADLVSAVVKQEDELDAEDSETIMHVKVTLHHTHLPKMDELGVLTYDSNSKLITQ